MRCSVLDLGSNSFHVLVADLDGATLVPVEREREMLHLGRVVARHGGVPEADVVRAEETVAHLTALAHRSGTEEHLAVATAALRDADDGPAVLARLSAAAGTPVRVLTGEEEARLAALGVRAAVAITAEPVLVLDLGGGSLELAVGQGGDVEWSASVPLGVSRLSTLVDTDPVRKREVRALHDAVDAAIDPLVDEVAARAPMTTVSVGGTVRALARVVGTAATTRDGRAGWLPPTLNQYRVSRDDLLAVRDQLLPLNVAARADVPGVKERRADHLHVAAIVLTRVLDRLGVTETVVSDWGLREGMLLDAHGVTDPPDGAALRRAEVTRLRRAFPTDDHHLDHLAELTGRLFDRLADVHGAPPADRELLEHAARLHDLGETVALRRHPLHGAYLVENAELRGFDPGEIGVLSTLVRSHRSRGIARSHAAFAALGSDHRERARRLLPLLQLADRLDRTGDRGTRDVTVVRDGGGVILEPVGAPLPVAPVELRRTAELFERTYGVALRFAAATATAPGGRS